MNLTRMLGTAVTASMAVAAMIAIAAQRPTFQGLLPVQAQIRTAEMAPGITQFFNNLTQYQFACGEMPGHITRDSMEGNTLVIDYTYPAANEVRTGQLVGNVSRNGGFSGTYTTQSRLGPFQDEMTLTFADNGTANSTYGQGEGSTRIFL